MSYRYTRRNAYSRPISYRSNRTRSYSRRPAYSSQRRSYSAAPRRSYSSAPRRSYSRAAPRSSSDNSIGKALGAAIGSSLGGPAGGAVGSALGAAGQSLIRKITGFGDYKITSNSLVGQDKTPAGSPPVFQNMSGRGVRIQHREYIQDVVSSASADTFAADEFLIQPALQASFPWLSSIGEQFEEYQINGMIFEFRSKSADSLNSVNTALGSVIMATQYNVLNPSYQNKVQMEQQEFSVSGKPSITLMHPIECARGETPVFTLSTRSGPVISGDPRLYDFGRFTIATAGMQGTSVNVGELWVSYDITFLKPRVNGSSDVADHFQLPASISTSNYFGAVIPEPTLTSDLGCVLGSNTITIPRTYTGNILVLYNIIGSAASTVTPTVTPSDGASVLDLFCNSSGYNQVSYSTGGGGGSNATLSVQYMFRCVSGGVLTFSGGTLPASIARGDLFIVSLPATLQD